MQSFSLTILVLFVGGAYLAPSIVALVRQVPNTGSVVVINALLGWTLVGWAVSMAMAARSVPSRLTAPNEPVWMPPGFSRRLPR